MSTLLNKAGDHYSSSCYRNFCQLQFSLLFTINSRAVDPNSNRKFKKNFWIRIRIEIFEKNSGSLEGESPQGFLRAQNPKLS